jgi:hypothetical protein
MGEAEINAFLTHLAVEGRVSASTQTQALCALLFLYRTVLSRDVGELEGLVRARRKRKLPVVLTREEVKSILVYLKGQDHLLTALLYGTGMRLTEALRLRVKDVDFAYGQILIRDAKGAKDRSPCCPPASRRRCRSISRGSRGCTNGICGKGAAGSICLTRSAECPDHDDLHPCAQPWRARCPESGGHFVTLQLIRRALVG